MDVQLAAKRWLNEVGPAVSKITPPQMVSELIDQSLRRWDMQMVNDFFIPMDAEIILSIPLCTSA
jgi:hypothetical protein